MVKCRGNDETTDGKTYLKKQIKWKKQQKGIRKI